MKGQRASRWPVSEELIVGASVGARDEKSVTKSAASRLIKMHSHFLNTTPTNQLVPRETRWSATASYKLTKLNVLMRQLATDFGAQQTET